MNADKIEVRVLGITYSQLQQSAYLLILAEEDGSRRIPIIVGTSEAQSIAIRMENLQPPRPMTHDLITHIGKAFDLEFKEVFIRRFENGIFYSDIVMSTRGREVVIDARTSDAIAIAMRTSMPIYVAAEVMQVAGFEASRLDPESVVASKDATEKEPENLEQLSDAELQMRQQRAVAAEAYEEAALIQQILKKRKV